MRWMAPALVVFSMSAPLLDTSPARAGSGLDEGCPVAIGGNMDLNALEVARRQLRAMRYEHRCSLESFPADAHAFTKALDEKARLGWQLAAMVPGPDGKILVCLKRPRGPWAR